jgi:hypothetical protein
MEKSDSGTRNEARQPAPFKDNKVDFSKFKRSLSATDIAKLLAPHGGTVTFPSGPIETLSPIKTIGRGRTNLTIENAVTLVTLNSSIAWFLFSGGEEAPLGKVQIQFEPSFYGITHASNYVAEFNIYTGIYGGTFDLGGLVGSGTILNGGRYTFSEGPTTVQLVMRNVPSQPMTAWLQSTDEWEWFSTVIKFPDGVVNPG